MNNFNLPVHQQQPDEQLKILQSIQKKDPQDSKGKFTTSDGRTLVVNRQGKFSTGWRARLWNQMRMTFGGTDTSHPTHIKHKLIQLHQNISETKPKNFEALKKCVEDILNSENTTGDSLIKNYESAFTSYYLPNYLANNDSELKKEMIHIISMLSDKRSSGSTEAEKLQAEKSLQNIQECLVKEFSKNTANLVRRRLPGNLYLILFGFSVSPMSDFSSTQKKILNFLTVPTEDTSIQRHQWALETVIACKLKEAQIAFDEVATCAASNSLEPGNCKIAANTVIEPRLQSVKANIEKFFENFEKSKQKRKTTIFQNYYKSILLRQKTTHAEPSWVITQPISILL